MPSRSQAIPPSSATLHLALAQMDNWLARPEGVEHALQAAELAVQLGDRGTENRARALAGQIYVNRSMGAEALAILEPAVTGLDEKEPNAAPVFAELARLYMVMDRHEESVVVAERALRAAALERDTEVIANALVTQGSAISSLGRFDESEAVMRGAMALADRAGHVAAALRARNNLGSALTWEAPQRAIVQLANDGVELALRYGIAGWGAQHALSRATMAMSMGDWDLTRADLALVADWDLSEFHDALRASGRAVMAATSGDEAEVTARLAEARELATKIDTRPQVTSVALFIAHAHLLLGDWSAALDALAGFEGGGNDPLICQFSAFAAAALGDRETMQLILARSETLDSYRVSNAIRRQLRASAAAMDGRWDEARAGYVYTLAEYQDLDFNLEAAFIGLEFSAYLGERFDDARAAGEAASAWFEERGGSSVPERYRANFRGTAAPPAGEKSATQRSPAPVDAEQPA